MTSQQEVDDKLIECGRKRESLIDYVSSLIPFDEGRRAQLYTLIEGYSSCFADLKKLQREFLRKNDKKAITRMD